jgi:hypothetical protein
MFAADVAGPAAQRVIDSLSVYLHGLFFRMMDPTGLLARVPTPANRRYDAAVAELHRSVDEIIDRYRAAGIDHGDLRPACCRPATLTGTRSAPRRSTTRSSPCSWPGSRPRRVR